MSETVNLLGRVVAGKFKIEAPIGAGAMGEVYRARHTVLDTVIALKIMRPDIAKDAMFKERFYREAKAASRLDHANSVRVLDYGVEPDGLVYIAMEFLHGRDLLSVLRDEWPLPDTRIADILVQVLAAVSVAHELGIIHRDLKPENIMISVAADDDDQRPYHVKVCDFGIAKLSDPRAFQTENSARALTSSGTLIGTPEYMSPEQARGDALDARSDIYSVGIILYQLLVGRVPFSAENALGVVLKQVTDEPVPPSKVRPGVNARLEAICLRALKKSRDDRYQTAREMRRDLREVFGYGPKSHTDESGPFVSPAAPPRAAGFDATSAQTLVQEVPGHGESSTVRLNADGTPLAPRVAPPEASLRGAEGPRSADVDFTSKHTSDGTEVTVPMSVGSRYLGLFVAVAALALVVGGVGVFLFARSTGAPEASASPSASAFGPEASISLGNLPPTVAEPDPRTAPLEVASAASASAAPR
ncbi:MAG TPA: serine/threonine-protein kinase, partial [Labilithrix sp.]|nr:serine/threonine-protein kinase [Labilithrix sp.]